MLSPWALDTWFPPKLVRCKMRGKWCMTGADKGKMKKVRWTFPPQTNRTNTQVNSSTTFVLLNLAVCMTARWKNPHCLYTLSCCSALASQSSSSHRGQHIRGKWKEQRHSLLLHLRNCKASTPPQMATVPFFLCRFTSHAVCQCLVKKCGGWGERKKFCG